MRLADARRIPTTDMRVMDLTRRLGDARIHPSYQDFYMPCDVERDPHVGCDHARGICFLRGGWDA